MPYQSVCMKWNGTAFLYGGKEMKEKYETETGERKKKKRES